MIELTGQNKVTQYSHCVKGNPLVSICIQTYNHEKFIKECINGILFQQTNFNFEILLGEDDSDDGTRDICISYAENYPDKIRLFLHDRRNVIYIDDSPTGRYNMIYNMQMAKGKYIAFCEGDDYWTSPLKLQKQIDFLEKKTEYSLCFHDVHRVNIRNQIIQKNISTANQLNRTTFSQEEVLTLPYFTNTLSMVFRNSFTLEPWFLDLPMGDKPLLKILGLHGKAYFMAEVMGYYREHSQGATKTHNTFIKNDFFTTLKTNSTILNNLLLELQKESRLHNIIQNHLQWINFQCFFFQNQSTFYSRAIKILSNQTYLKKNNAWNVEQLGMLLFSKGLMREVFISITFRMKKSLANIANKKV